MSDESRKLGVRESDVPHHSTVLVLEIVAVVHDEARELGCHTQAYAFAGENANGVPEAHVDHAVAQVAWNSTTAPLDDPKPYAVDVHRVRHRHAAPIVGERPQ